MGRQPGVFLVIEDRMKHQEQREATFLKTSQDAFAIYQVKGGNELRNIRFEPLSWLESKGLISERYNANALHKFKSTHKIMLRS